MFRRESNSYGDEADAEEYDGEVQGQPWEGEEDMEEEEEGELSSVYDFVEVCTPGASGSCPSGSQSQGNRRSPTRIPVLVDDDDDEQDIVEDERHARVLYTNKEVRAKWIESLE